MRILIFMIVILISNSAFSAATNSARMKVTSIESRESGQHDIYFDGVVPDQGCSLSDRAILDESLTGGKSMFSVLLAAFMSEKGLVIRVNGCLSAPKIIKVQVYQ
ncbi:MAG: hypothetical protein ABJD02_03435 [Paraglaciecola sp.]|uniref:hypothetical protein n=1 Tax=Paraglaciecola sp. TaxID=1920173 RepID=UPI0032650710